MARPGLGTRCVQAGYSPKNGEPRQIPIIQSTTFKYESSAEMGKLFDLEASGYFYSRLQNPTNDAVAAHIAALEGGTAAMLTGSGHVGDLLCCLQYRRRGRPSGELVEHLRRQLQPLLRHDEAHGCRGHVRRPRLQPRRSWTPPSAPTRRPCTARPSPIPR